MTALKVIDLEEQVAVLKAENKKLRHDLRVMARRWVDALRRNEP